MIDPFQMKVHEVWIGQHIQDWHKWCDCECFDRAYIGVHLGQRQDIWVDDMGFMRNPTYPLFVWKQRQDPLAGYGLVLAELGENSISTLMTPDYAQHFIKWEFWEVRLKADQYFDQLSRIYLFDINRKNS